MNDQPYSALTFHTLRYLFCHYCDAEIYACKSPADVKALIWQRIQPILKDKADKDRFLKGIACCDFNVISAWINEHAPKSLERTCTSEQELLDTSPNT